MTDTSYKKKIGKQGEDLAVNFLKRSGFRILERNFLVRGGEIDIIAQDKDVLVFVEVKARYSHEFGLPAESITFYKLKALLKTALFYVQKIHWGERPYRLDLVTIDFANDRDNPIIELIKDISS